MTLIFIYLYSHMRDPFWKSHHCGGRKTIARKLLMLMWCKVKQPFRISFKLWFRKGLKHVLNFNHVSSPSSQWDHLKLGIFCLHRGLSQQCTKYITISCPICLCPLLNGWMVFSQNTMTELIFNGAEKLLCWTESNEISLRGQRQSSFEKHIF